MSANGRLICNLNWGFAFWHAGWIAGCSSDQHFKDKNQSTHPMSQVTTLNKWPPGQVLKLWTGYGLHPAPLRGPYGALQNQRVGGLRPTSTVCQWLCLKSQQGLGLIPFFSPENSPFGANDRAWARGPRPCQRPRPSLLLSNKGWGQRPTVKMAPGRLQDAAVPVPVPVPVRLRAREWSRKATPSADMAPDLASASQWAEPMRSRGGWGSRWDWLAARIQTEVRGG